MPEELNSVLADHASDYLFALTATALKNLRAGLSSRSYLTGDIMVNSIFYANLLHLPIINLIDLVPIHY